MHSANVKGAEIKIRYETGTEKEKRSAKLSVRIFGHGERFAAADRIVAVCLGGWDGRKAELENRQTKKPVFG